MRLLVLVVMLLLGLACAQNVCLNRECPKELAACDKDCAKAMGECTFACTLNSVGCLQKCLRDRPAAVDLLECSFRKCIQA